jgi:uncharacterized protein (DUF1786 family)
LKILAADIGTGTQDIFVLDTRLDIENGFKLILPSPTMNLRRRIQDASRHGKNILLQGVTMGGGPCSWAIEDHLKLGLKVFATPAAAQTLNDDLTEVSELGIKIISQDEADKMDDKVEKLTLGDFNFTSIKLAFQESGVSLDDLDLLTVAVFDHGNAPRGYSDRKFRFEYLDRQVKSTNRLSSFAFPSDHIPSSMTRLQAVRESLIDVSTPLMVMDTAPAAVLGASLDPVAAKVNSKMIVNIGNFHTLAFRLGPSGIEGVFEHHTGMLTKESLENILQKFSSGLLINEEIFEGQGHGALMYSKQPMDLASPGNHLIITGPRRSMLKDSKLNPYFAVPYGDMMIAGCFGLLAAAVDHFPQFSEVLNAVLGGNGSPTTPWDLYN